MRILLFVILFVFVTSVDVNADQFSRSKTVIKKLYRNVLTEAYYIYAPCKVKDAKCALYSKTKKTVVTLSIEHVATASRIVAFLKCKNKDRGKCAKETTKADQCLGDPLNLYPSTMTVNRTRSNKSFVSYVREPRNKFIFHLPLDRTTIVPPATSRGKIARSMFYMHDIGCIRLTKVEKLMFTKWANKYPVTVEESIRNVYFSHFLGVYDRSFMKK